MIAALQQIADKAHRADSGRELMLTAVDEGDRRAVFLTEHHDRLAEDSAAQKRAADLGRSRRRSYQALRTKTGSGRSYHLGWAAQVFYAIGIAKASQVCRSMSCKTVLGSKSCIRARSKRTACTL